MSSFLPVLGTMAAQNASAVAITGGTAELSSIVSEAAAGQVNMQISENSGQVAVNGTFNFAALSKGFFWIAETNATGQVAFCSTDGVTVRIIHQSSTAFTTTQDNPGTVNLYYNGGTPRIQNKLGAAAIFSINVLKLA